MNTWGKVLTKNLEIREIGLSSAGIPGVSPGNSPSEMHWLPDRHSQMIQNSSFLRHLIGFSCSSVIAPYGEVFSYGLYLWDGCTSSSVRLPQFCEMNPVPTLKEHETLPFLSRLYQYPMVTIRPSIRVQFFHIKSKMVTIRQQ